MPHGGELAGHLVCDHAAKGVAGEAEGTLFLEIEKDKLSLAAAFLQF